MVFQKTCHSIGAKTVAPANVIGHGEVDHRAANSSQLISGHLGLHARQSPNPESGGALAAAVDHIFSIAGICCRLRRLEPQDTVNVGSYRPDSDAALEQGCADDAQRLPATGGWARSF
ncbi:histidine kinase dimerization/phosphoacceptor domain -containing protein [Microvirga yunnanensis]|uniref:histidine kinase dimerization/phosphoacceptor domain -containing protein n=1 Tax=Microvirga yunnanensis TaxID=2953740 RepID=UPI0035A0E216